MNRWKDGENTSMMYEKKTEPDQPVTFKPGEELNTKVDNIKKREIKNAIKLLTNGNSAEVDGIAPEALK